MIKIEAGLGSGAVTEDKLNSFGVTGLFVFFNNVFSASEKVVIRAYKDSAAWKYAEKHGIKHEEL